MDTGRPGCPDPGGQTTQQGEQTSSPNGPLVKGVIQKQNTTGPPSSEIIQKENQTSPVVSESSKPPRQSQRKEQFPGEVDFSDPTVFSHDLSPQPQTALPHMSSDLTQSGPLLKGAVQERTQHISNAGGSHGSPRQPQRGKQKASSPARSQQPRSTSAYEVQNMKAALPPAPPDAAKERRPQLRQRMREKNAAPSAPLTGMAPEYRHDDEDRARVGEPPHAASPASDLPLPIKPTKSIVWVDCPFAREPFGSLVGIPGVTVKVTVPPTRMGDPLILLSMGVNKYDLSKPISKVEAEVSLFELVLRPRILTKFKPREQHSFRYAYLQDGENSLGEARAKIMNITQGNLKHLVCMDTGVISYRVSRPYERQYWTRLRDSDLLAHRAIEVSANCLNSQDTFDASEVHFKFWFRLPCVVSGRERICAGLFLQRGEERRYRSAASERNKVPKPTVSESQSPSETVSDDRLTVTTGSRFAPTLVRSPTSPLSVEQQLVEQQIDYHIAELRHQREIRDVERQNAAWKAEILTSAAQQHQQQAVVSKQKDEQISELQAKNDRLNKRLELERGVLCRKLKQYEDFVRSIRLTSRHLPGTSAEDEANESDDEFPAIPDPSVGESHQEPAHPSDQGIESEPLDEPEEFPDETYPPKDDASDTVYDDDAAIGINELAKPPTSSPPKIAAEDHEQFNTDWAAECHNLKKMKRSAKRKRRQQKKLTERD